MTNLYSLLTSRFPEDRTRPCFILGDVHIDYGGFETMIGQIGGWLRSKGVVPNDRVLVQASKSVEMVALYLATLKIGAVFVPLNTAYTQAEIDYFIGDAEPRLIIRDALDVAEEARSFVADPDIHDSAPDDLASIIYTSGTTGRSKGAMLSHAALISNGLALQEAWDIGRDDILLHALPVFHVHGLFVALHPLLLAGAQMIWQPKFDDAAVIAELARATVMMGVPTFYTRLLANPDFTRDVAAPIRLFVSGSAPLLPSTFEAFEERTGKRILERYGMSEAGIITTNPLRGERLAGSVGHALPGVSVRVSGGEGTGPIEIKGPNLFTGYWRMPDRTSEEFTDDGYFVTGDIGRIEADGRLWISGREKDLIISGGFNIYPKEIETAIDELPGVVESAVIGVPHPDFGEAVVAIVIGVVPADANALLRDGLAGFKLPKKIVQVDDLPRNAMGKVQKNLLRQTYADILADE